MIPNKDRMQYSPREESDPMTVAAESAFQTLSPAFHGLRTYKYIIDDEPGVCNDLSQIPIGAEIVLYEKGDRYGHDAKTGKSRVLKITTKNLPREIDLELVD